MARSKKYHPAVIVGLIIFFVDFVSKVLTNKFLPEMSQDTLWYPYGGIGVFQNVLGVEFSIVHATNRGAAWSLFSEHQEILLFFRIALVVALMVYAFFFNKSRWAQVPLALIIAGALGNIVDYFLYGHVVDMLHFIFWGYDYPVFNIADSSIFIGIIWLFIASVWHGKKK